MLQARYERSLPAHTATEPTFKLSECMLHMLHRRGGDKRMTDSEAQRGTHGLQTRSGTSGPVNAVAASEREIRGPEEEPLRLLVCVNDTINLTWTYEDLRDINDDRELIHHLRKRLSIFQNRFIPKGIKAISLAKVSFQTACCIFQD